MLVAIADREVQRILLELLNQMDGFDQNVNVKVKEIAYIREFGVCVCVSAPEGINNNSH